MNLDEISQLGEIVKLKQKAGIQDDGCQEVTQETLMSYSDDFGDIYGKQFGTAFKLAIVSSMNPLMTPEEMTDAKTSTISTCAACFTIVDYLVLRKTIDNMRSLSNGTAESGMIDILTQSMTGKLAEKGEEFNKSMEYLGLQLKGDIQ
jgi:hypothetical protein